MSDTSEQDEHVAGDVAKVAAGSSLLLVGWILDQAIRFGLVLLLTWTLSPEAWGAYVAAMAVLLVAMAFSPLGLESGVLLAVSQRHQTGSSTRQHVQLGMVLALTVGVAVAIGMAALAQSVPGVFGDPEVAHAVTLLSPILAVHGVATVAHGALLGAGAVRSATIGLHLIRPAAHLLLVGAALLVFTGLDGILFATALSYGAGAVALVGTAIFLRRELVGLHTTSIPWLPALKALLAVSLPLTLAETLHRLHLSLDVLMLTSLTGDLGGVGVYRVAVTVALIGALPVAAAIVMSKAMVGSLLDRPERLSQVVQATSRWLLVAVVPLYIVLVTVPDLVLLPFGEAYAAAAVPLTILVLGQLTHATLAITTPLLAMSTGRWVHVALGAAALCVNAALNLWLVPIWGLNGAAVASAAAISLWAVMRAVATWRVLGIVAHDRRGWVLLASAGVLGAGCVAMAEGQDLPVRVGIAAATATSFILIALVLGVDAVDRDIGRNLIARVSPRLAGRTG